MPVRLVELLEEREISFVEVPDEEFESMGPNVLALGPTKSTCAGRQPGNAPPHGSRQA